MEALFYKLTQMGMAAGWLVLAVAVLRPVLKKSPKWMFCILWGLVALRLLCPFTVESPFSLLPAENVLPAAPQVTFSWVETPPATEQPLKEQLPTEQPSTVQPPAVQSPGVQPPAAATPTRPKSPVNPLPLLWLAGTAVMLSYAGVRYLGVRRRVREAVPAGDGVFLCDRVTSPFLLGIRNPRVYLPSGLAEGDRVYVLAHEQAHLKRGDQLWKPLGFFLLAVYWFQPLLWLGYLLFCRDLELACDERVIREMGSPWKKPYSQALINCSAPSRLAVYPLAFGEVGVKERVKNILTYRKASFWILLITIVAIAVTAVCFLTNPVQPKEPEGTETPGPTPIREGSWDYDLSEVPDHFGCVPAGISGSIACEFGGKVLLTTGGVSSARLYEYDKRTGVVELYCKDPDCHHNTFSCPAVGIDELDLYKGKVYAHRYVGFNESVQLVELKDGGFEKVLSPVGVAQHHDGHLYVQKAYGQLLKYPEGDFENFETVKTGNPLGAHAFAENYYYITTGSEIQRFGFNDPYTIETVVENTAGAFRIHGDYLYYCSAEGYTLMRCELDGSNPVSVTQIGVWPPSVNFDEEYIYFCGYDPEDPLNDLNNQVYRMKKDLSTAPILMADVGFPVQSIHTAYQLDSVFLYCSSPYNPQGYYVLDKDGSNLQMLELPA